MKDPDLAASESCYRMTIDMSDYASKQPTADRGHEVATVVGASPGKHTLAGDAYAEAATAGPSQAEAMPSAGAVVQRKVAAPGGASDGGPSGGGASAAGLG